jgi:hypothetical protein
MRGALTGIRVVELADEQAEYCGLTLAYLGEGTAARTLMVCEGPPAHVTTTMIYTHVPAISRSAE